MTKVLVNHLNVRTEPSLTSQIVAFYDKGQIITSGESIIKNEEGN